MSRVYCRLSNLLGWNYKCECGSSTFYYESIPDDTVILLCDIRVYCNNCNKKTSPHDRLIWSVSKEVS